MCSRASFQWTHFPLLATRRIVGTSRSSVELSRLKSTQQHRPPIVLLLSHFELISFLRDTFGRELKFSEEELKLFWKRSPVEALSEFWNSLQRLLHRLSYFLLIARAYLLLQSCKFTFIPSTVYIFCSRVKRSFSFQSAGASQWSKTRSSLGWHRACEKIKRAHILVRRVQCWPWMNSRCQCPLTCVPGGRAPTPWPNTATCWTALQSAPSRFGETPNKKKKSSPWK